MSCASGGEPNIHWDGILKKFLENNNNGLFGVAEMCVLSRTIICRKFDFDRIDSQYESFCTSFATLALESIGGKIEFSPITDLELHLEASRILIEYLIAKAKEQVTKKLYNHPVSTQRILFAIISACSARCIFNEMDRYCLTKLVSNAVVPPKGLGLTDRIFVTGYELFIEGVVTEKPAETKVHISSYVTSREIMDTFKRPFENVPLEKGFRGPHEFNSWRDTVGNAAERSKTWFTKRISAMMVQSGFNMALLDIAIGLPIFSVYHSAYVSAVESGNYSFPMGIVSEVEAVVSKDGVEGLSLEMDVIRHLMCLPIFEPLNERKVRKLSNLVLASMYSAGYAVCYLSEVQIAAATTPGKTGFRVPVLSAEDCASFDRFTKLILIKTMAIQDEVLGMFSKSANISPDISQNLIMMSAWLLSTTLQKNLKHIGIPKINKSKDSAEDSGKELGFGITPSKVLHGLTPAYLTLVSHLMSMVSKLFDSYTAEYKQASLGDQATYDIFQKSSAVGRLSFVFSNAQMSLLQFIFVVAPIAYRKACALTKMIKVETDASTNNVTSVTRQKKVEENDDGDDDDDDDEDDDEDEETVDDNGDDDDDDDDEEEHFHSSGISSNEESAGEENSLFGSNANVEGDNTSQNEEDVIVPYSLPGMQDISDEDNDDGSDDVLYGQWLGKIISTPPPEKAKAKSAANDDRRTDKSVQDQIHIVERRAAELLLPEADNPIGYLDGATNLLLFLNNRLVINRAEFARNYMKKELCDGHISLLAALIKDLDLEGVRNCDGFKSKNVSKLFESFSQAVVSLAHNLIAFEVLSDELQDCFLDHLAVNPGASKEVEWPLRIGNRRLSVLAKVLSMNLNDDVITAIWDRLLNTLFLCASNPLAPGTFAEDMNVEHTELILFVFYSLSFRQKKQALLNLTGTIISLGPVVHTFSTEIQFVCLSRLLILFDHLIKHLYDPPHFILREVEWNLRGGGLHGMESRNADAAQKIFSAWTELRENYVLYGTPKEGVKSYVAEFYTLSVVAPNFSYEPPKLDGLAVSFLVGSETGFKYHKLIESLLEIFNTMNIGLRVFGNEPHEKAATMCAVQYCSLISWRLLMQLPISLIDLESIEQKGEKGFDISPYALYSSVWGPRCGRQAFTTWLRDTLGKQACPNSSRDSLMRSIANTTTQPTYDLNMLRKVSQHLSNNMQPRNMSIKYEVPSLLDLILCDTLVSKFLVTMEETATILTQEDLAFALVALKNEQEAEDECANMAQLATGFQTANITFYNNLLKEVIELVASTHAFIVTSLMQQICEVQTGEATNASFSFSAHEMCIITDAISLAGCKDPLFKDMGSILLLTLPDSVSSVLVSWSDIKLTPINIETFAANSNKVESYLLCIVEYHMKTLSGQQSFNLNHSYKRLLNVLLVYLKENISRLKDNQALKGKLLKAISPMLLDLRTTFAYDLVLEIVERTSLNDSAKRPEDVKDVSQIVYGKIVNLAHSIIISYGSSLDDETGDQPRIKLATILVTTLQWLERIITDTSSRKAYVAFLENTENGRAQTEKAFKYILLSLAKMRDVSYTTNILSTLNRLLDLVSGWNKRSTGSSFYARLLRHAYTIDRQRKKSKSYKNDPENEMHILKEDKLKNDIGATILKCTTCWLSLDQKDLQDLLWIIITTKDCIEGCVVSSVDAKGGEEQTDGSASKDDDTNGSEMSDTECGVAHEDESVQLQNLKYLESVVNYVTGPLCALERKNEVIENLMVSILPVMNDVFTNGFCVSFGKLLSLMKSLADAISPKGHIILFNNLNKWLEHFAAKLMVVDRYPSGSYTTCGLHLMTYISTVLTALGPSFVLENPPYLNPDMLPLSIEFTATGPEALRKFYEAQDMDADGEGDENLNKKVCTYTVSGGEFLDQHWYHCHTCKMVDKVGMCSVCAKVCHNQHEVTYSKKGNFFCDCGAKGKEHCVALVPRSSEVPKYTRFLNSDKPSVLLTSTSYRKNPSGKALNFLLKLSKCVKPLDEDRRKLELMAQKFEPVRNEFVINLDTLDKLMRFALKMKKELKQKCEETSPSGCWWRAERDFIALHASAKKELINANIMNRVLDSDAIIFKNMKFTYEGDQGQAIRTLLSNNALRRTSVCCLSAPFNKRKHLVSTNVENTQVDVLQLRSLVKQVDRGETRIHLDELSSLHMSYAIVSMASNPSNDEVIAVCGLKDFQVLVINSAGIIMDQIIMVTELEGSNNIIRAIWLPGSATQVALVTADFVKVYDLATDTITPTYYFVVPTGKVRDATFIYSEEGMVIVILSSAGHIYTQKMDSSSCALNGAFYVTETVTIDHPSATEANNALNGGGVSIYYSHKLKLLFVSFGDGKSYILFFPKVCERVNRVIDISTETVRCNGNQSDDSPAALSQALWHWTETHEHPGLICAVTVTNSSAFVFMILPETIMTQEIKPHSSKVKLNDFVLTHYADSRGYYTALMFICDDGSVRLYLAELKDAYLSAGYYQNKTRHPFSFRPDERMRSKDVTPLFMGQRATTDAPATKMLSFLSPTLSFPVDFFEHCTVLENIEYGGNLLEIYSATQIYERLKNEGKGVAHSSRSGFTMSLVNHDFRYSIVGIRIHLGQVNSNTKPSSIEFFKRMIIPDKTTSRWYDIPFTRDEISSCDGKLSIKFGPSCEKGDYICVIDSMKVYGVLAENVAKKMPVATSAVKNGVVYSALGPAVCSNKPNFESLANAATPMDYETELLISAVDVKVNKLDALLCNIFNVVEGYLRLDGSLANISMENKETAKTIARQYNEIPCTLALQWHSNLLMSSVLSDLQQHYEFRDIAYLYFVLKRARRFTMLHPKDIDSEQFYYMVEKIRHIAVHRPKQFMYYYFDESPRQQILEKRRNSPWPHIRHSPAYELTTQLIDTMFRLQDIRLPHPMVAPILEPGLCHVESTIYCIVEILHSFLITDCNTSTVESIFEILLSLLTSRDQTISYACKFALSKILWPHRKSKESISEQATSNVAKTNETSEQAPDTSQIPPSTPQNANGESSGSASVAAIMHGNGQNLPPIDFLDQSSADDDPMVELAIALSLQDQNAQEIEDDPMNDEDMENIENINVSLVDLNNFYDDNVNEIQEYLMASPPAENNENAAAMAGENADVILLSDTTASAPGSDDESNHPVDSDISTIVAASESVANAGDISSTSSAFGNISSIPDASGSGIVPMEVDAVEGMIVDVDPSETQEEEADCKLRHQMKMDLLRCFVRHIRKLNYKSGEDAIPYLQVLSILTMDLQEDQPDDVALMNTLLEQMEGIVCKGYEFRMRNFTQGAPTPRQKFELLILRFFSIMMSDLKHSKTKEVKPDFLGKITAKFLGTSGMLHMCLKLLKSELLEYWRNAASNVENEGDHLLKASTSKMRDLSPFFYQKENHQGLDCLFNLFPQMLTELAIRIPYQIQKHSVAEGIAVVFSKEWENILCEYMMIISVGSIRRQARKLLLHISKNKENYRALRDAHLVGYHLNAIWEATSLKELLPLGENWADLDMSYARRVEIADRLRAISEVPVSRINNWQRYLISEPESVRNIMALCCVTEEELSPVFLQLLLSGLCIFKQDLLVRIGRINPDKNLKTNEAPYRKSSEDDTIRICQIARILIHRDPNLFKLFIKKCLLESHNPSTRANARLLALTMYKHLDGGDRKKLLKILCGFWELIPKFGRNAQQLTEAMAIIVQDIKTDQKADEIQKDMGVLRMLKWINETMSQHPNQAFYAQMSQVIQLEGYYLESDPCAVCNWVEGPFNNIKLNSVKTELAYQTRKQYFKFPYAYSVYKISLKITDIVSAKMIKTIAFYYNTNHSTSMVEVKQRNTHWDKFGECCLTPNQSEVKLDLTVPINAIHMMIEYKDYFETVQTSPDKALCPRCNIAVNAIPGTCNSCGDNVFQCQRCRGMNYDERDPFLCGHCGLCRFAKLEYTLAARPIHVVEKVTSEADRKLTMTTIMALLEKANTIYGQLHGVKPFLQSSLNKVREHMADSEEPPISDYPIPETAANMQNVVNLTGTPTVAVSAHLQNLAIRYSSDCSKLYRELGSILTKVYLYRRAIASYDNIIGKIARDEGGALSRSQDGNVATPCYGCLQSAAEQSLQVMKVFAIRIFFRTQIYESGILKQLIECNIHKGSTITRRDALDITFEVVNASHAASAQLCDILTERIKMPLLARKLNPDLIFSVKREIKILSYMLTRADWRWELKTKLVMRLLVIALREDLQSNLLNAIVIPCLNILRDLFTPPYQLKNASATYRSVCSVNLGSEINVDFKKWIKTSGEAFADEWRKQKMTNRCNRLVDKYVPQTKQEWREMYLEEKYANVWTSKTYGKVFKLAPKILDNNPPWLVRILFNPTSRRVRSAISEMMCSLCLTFDRTKYVIDSLYKMLDQIPKAGIHSQEYLVMFGKLIAKDDWSLYVAVRGIFGKLEKLFLDELDRINNIDQRTLTTDLSQGTILQLLAKYIAQLLSNPLIKKRYRRQMMDTILRGYLSLRVVVAQRNTAIEETQDILIKLVEDMTSGTEEDCKAFMALCVEKAEKCAKDDYNTPTFVFESLCSIIHPAVDAVEGFQLHLEKDSSQEDYLNGRMIGNPYSSDMPGMGPLMRDIKNKICRDCEMITLLDDDNTMELLVNNKIISLDLPVKEVYKKVWLVEGQENDPMRIVYRIRGLNGDATEEFVETLSSAGGQEFDNEEHYKMANVLAESNGIQVILSKFEVACNAANNENLLKVLLRLMDYCVKVRKNLNVLIKLETNTLPKLLDALIFLIKKPTIDAEIIDQLLSVMCAVISEAERKLEGDSFKAFTATFGMREDPSDERLPLIFDAAPQFLKKESSNNFAKVMAALVYDSKAKMNQLMAYFSEIFDFHFIDKQNSTVNVAGKIQLFCDLCNGIGSGKLGSKLKDHILEMKTVDKAIKYIMEFFSDDSLKSLPSFWVSDSAKFKEFIGRPSMKYILTILTGLATDHVPTQVAIPAECITIIHRLEQVSSDEHVGIIAENLLDALSTNPEVSERIEQVRQETKLEKKRLAMAMREKHLESLGLQSNAKGQVTAGSSKISQFDELGEETGLTCVICREGYHYQPTKLIGLYTFTKRCRIEEYEPKKKTMGYTTVSHFNAVHAECHMAAVRLARTRDEWESAKLQNANTKCNGLLPVWGPQVPESQFASCLARHNTYLQEGSAQKEISYSMTVHDLKLLLLRFACGKKFNEDSSGGGPQSNMQLVPYIVHLALYLLNTNENGEKERANLEKYLESISSHRLYANSYEVEGPFYWATFSLLLHGPNLWNVHRITHLKRLFVTSHVRQTHPAPCAKSFNLAVKNYTSYKQAFLFFGLIDAIYRIALKPVPLHLGEEQWHHSLAEYIRNNDEALLKAADKLLDFFTNELSPVETFEEFCDVVGLLGNEIEAPDTFFQDTLTTLHPNPSPLPPQ